MTHRISRTIVASTLGLVTLGAIGAAPVSAKAGDVVRTGSCSAHSDWKLKLQPRDGRIEYEFEVDSNVSGQRWNVRITDNGNLVFAGARRTQPPSGSWSVENTMRNLAGTDRVVARSTNPATGETCVGRASL